MNHDVLFAALHLLASELFLSSLVQRSFLLCSSMMVFEQYKGDLVRLVEFN